MSGGGTAPDEVARARSGTEVHVFFEVQGELLVL